MLVQTGILLLLLTSVRTSNYEDSFVARRNNDIIARFSLWPSMLNGAKLMRLQKRDTQEGISEGVSKANVQPIAKDVLSNNNGNNKAIVAPIDGKSRTINNVELVKGNIIPATKENVTVSSVQSSNSTKANVTTTVTSEALDINKPGAVKRGLIVFSGFSLIAVAYFIFYRNKKKNSEGNNQQNDANQFRYGVLESEDKTELSRIPLTMESDDDDDEDLEIFDLGQKNKSLSYVNLQTNDYDVVVNPESSETDRNNLLLDIEDASEDTLINWSKNDSKAIL